MFENLLDGSVGSECWPKAIPHSALFPPWLLWSVIGLGVIDCGIAAPLLAAVYERAA